MWRLLLLATGETSASVAGLLIAAFSLGGVFYSLVGADAGRRACRNAA